MRSTVTVQVMDQVLSCESGTNLDEKQTRGVSRSDSLISIWPVMESGLNAFQVGEYIYGGTCPQTR